MGERRPIRDVLVVDDDDRILASWKRAAGRAHTVHVAQDADAARELAENQPFDLAIIDLRLGKSSGLELVRDLRAINAEAQIVLCSGYLSVVTAVAAVRAGADLIVFKPITFREILKNLEEQAAELEVDETPTLARAEWEHISRVLADCNGNISAAARRLGIYRSSLQRRLRKLAPRQ